MKHSIALVTGATYGLGHAAAHLLAAEGYREVIDSGRSRLARIQEAAAQFAAETEGQVFMPLELELNAPARIQSALVKRGRRGDFLLPNAGMVPGKKRVLTAADVEAAQATPSGQHQLTVGLLQSPSNNNLTRRTK